MGQTVDECDVMSVYTRKRVAGVGDTIWLIGGTGERPKHYTLNSWFVVSQITPADNAEFSFTLAGTDGGPLRPAPALNDFGWFRDMLKRSANFSIGLHELKDAEVINHFKDLASEAGRPMA